MEPKKLIQDLSNNGIHLGVDISKRSDISKNLVLISFTDKQSFNDIDELILKLKQTLGETEILKDLNVELPQSYVENNSAGVFKVNQDELLNFYQRLSKLNVSPDENIYPLGSCTMKYNPYINDYSASLSGFTNSHPEAPIEDIQGSLEVIYSIQERI